MWTRVLIAVAVLAIGMIVARSLSAASIPAVGSMAPDFALQSQESANVSLKDFRGKWVVLYFYPKDFTSGCTVEAHNFQRDQQEYVQRNAIVLGVSTDNAESQEVLHERRLEF